MIVCRMVFVEAFARWNCKTWLVLGVTRKSILFNYNSWNGFWTFLMLIELGRFSFGCFCCWSRTLERLRCWNWEFCVKFDRIELERRLICRRFDGWIVWDRVDRIGVFVIIFGALFFLWWRVFIIIVIVFVIFVEPVGERSLSLKMISSRGEASNVTPEYETLTILAVFCVIKLTSHLQYSNPNI